jgi:hypothetical protein
VIHLLRALQAHPDDWFYALRSTTRENPVTSAMAGDFDKMRDAWLRWGKKYGLL